MPNVLPNTLDVNIVRMYKALFDEAPGFTLLSAYRQLGDVQAVSAQLNAQFNSLSNAQWAGMIATNLHLTGQARTAAVDYLTILQNLSSNAQTWRAQNLAGILLGYANNYESDPLFGSSAAYFNNSALTSYEYSINPANTTTDANIRRLADEPNTAPVVVNDTAAATEGGGAIAGSVATNDSDAELDVLSYSLATNQPPVAGFSLGSNGAWSFDPTNPAYDSIANGATRQVVINVTASDGALRTNGTLTITVTGTNDLPTAHAVVASGAEDTAINVTPSVSDADVGDTFNYIAATQPLRGTVVFNAGTGKFVYTPSANFNGTDSFAYTVTDAAGAASTNFVTVTVGPVNDAPVALAISGAGQEDSSGIAVTPASTDVDTGDSATYSIVTQPANGTVSFNGTNFIYVPNANYNGTDTFTYRATDTGGASSTATATITVTPVNDAPVANSGVATTNEDQAVSGTVTSSDIDTGDTKAFAVNSQAAHGTVTINASTGAYTYTPNANFNGTDSFTFKVTDSGNATATATVSINVVSVNDAPVALDMVASGNEDQNTNGQVGATDVDGDTLTYTVTTQPANGTVTMNPDGTFSYTPLPNYYGPDSFVFTVADGNGGTDTGTVTLAIAQVDDVLTTGVDAVNGSSRDDRVLGNQLTLNAGDSITGGGGNDSVIISLENLPDGGRNFASFVLTGVELFQITNDGGENATFDLSSSDGIQRLTSTNSTADVAFNYANTVPDSDSDGHDEINLDVLNLTDGVNIVLDVRNDQAAGLDEVNLRLTDSDDDGLDANEISLVAEAASVAGNLGAVYEDVGDIPSVVDGDDAPGDPDDDNAAPASGVELVNVNTNGSDGSVRVNDLNTPGTTRINITTAAGLTIGDTNSTLADAQGEIENPLSASVVTVDAGSSTAGVVASTRDTDADVTITGGSGNDRFETAEGDDLITLGAGNDTVHSSGGWDSISAGDGNDVVRAGSGNNTVDGGAGNDNIRSGGDQDSIIGGEGNDTIEAGSGNNTVTGDAGNDLITVGEDSDTVNGGTGNDTINFGDGGSDIIMGGEGNDVLNGGTGVGSNYTEFWHTGNFTLYDQVDGGDGTDTLNLTGDSGDDNDLDTVRNVENIVFSGGAWNIQVLDGSWFDSDTTATSLNFTAVGGTVVFDGNDDGVSTNDGPGLVAVPNDEGLLSRAITVYGSNQNDTIKTGIGNDSVEGNAGDDVVETWTGNDVVRPGRGTDNVNLGAGDDVVIYKGYDGNIATGQLDVADVNDGGNGGAGNDVIQIEAEDYLIGGGEVSTAVLGAGTANIDRLKVVDLDNDGIGHRVDVTLDAGYAQTVLIVDAEDLDSDEQLNLNASANAANENLTVIGGAGNDTIDMGDNLGIADDIDGNNGTDLLKAQTVVDADFTNVREVEGLDLTKPDNDTATIGALAQAAGIRTVWDDAGNDTIDAGAYTVGLTININGGLDVVTGGTGNDTINDGGDTADTISGGAGNDLIVSSGTSVDVIDGGTGNDTIDGLGGDELTTGGDGDDLFVGYGTQVSANDTLNGGNGNDTLHLSDAAGNVSADIALPNVTFLESIVAVDADNDGLGNVAHVVDIDFVAGSVATLTVINVSGRGYDGTTNGTGTSPAAYGTGGDALNVDLSAIGDKDYAFNITGGLGNDTVTGSALPENLNFQAGGGDDWLNVDATDLGTTLTMAGGAGTDRINMISGLLTDDSFESISSVEIVSSHNGGVVTGTNTGAGDAGITLAVVPLNAQFGAQADAALNETTLGYISVVGTSGNDALLLDAAFNDEVRVNLSAGGSDAVNATASSSRVVVIADEDDIDATDVISGGTGATDAFWLTANGGASAIPTNVTRVENFVVVENDDASFTIDFVDGNFTGVVGNTINVDASALNDTIISDNNGGEGGLTVNAGGVATGKFSVMGGTGADSITTGGGADTINGGADWGPGGANETVSSGGGDDVVTTGLGSDLITAGTGNDNVNAGEGNNTVWGGDGNDTVNTGGGADSVDGGAGNDTMNLGGGSDTAFGQDGADSITAGAGNDEVSGGAGADTINGDDGDDILIGNGGADVMNGGAGADRFVYQLRSDSNGLLSAIDTINGFQSGTDVIDFRYVGLDPAVIAQFGGITGATIFWGGNAINYADATAVVHNGDGIVQVVFQQDEQVLWVDLNDDGSLDNNDLRIKVAGVSTLQASDVMGGNLMGTIVINNGENNTLAGFDALRRPTIAADHFTHVGGGGATIGGGDGNDTLIGSAGTESLIGGAGNDSLVGNAGADTLTGGVDNDNLTGGADADTFNVDAGNDTVTDWEAGTDTLNVTVGATATMATTGGDDTVDLSANVNNSGTIVVNGNGGADNVTGSGGFDSVSGGAGNDTVSAGGGADWVSGGDNDDSLMGDAGADTLAGGSGNDVIDGGADADWVSGDAGDDTIVADATDTMTDGGDDTDTLDVQANYTAGADGTLVNVENVTVGSGLLADLSSQSDGFAITGAGGNETITGSSGVDIIDGGAGDDVLNGSAGADEVSGGDGDDTIVGTSDDTLLDGGNHNVADTLQTIASFNDANGDGQIANIEAVTMTVAGTSLDLDQQSEAFTINGSSGVDTVMGGAGADTIFGNGGADWLNGGAGADSVDGGSGNDTIVGASNDAVLDGGDAADTDTLRTDTSFDDLGGDGQILDIDAVVMTTSSTLDLDQQTEAFTITGSGGADTILGGQAADTINGGNGADSITGGPAAGDADSISGGAGNDTIVGDDFDSLIDGGAGTGDLLQVGANFNDGLGNGQITGVEIVTATADALTIDFDQQTEGFTFNGFVGGSSTITGGSGNDTFVGDSGADSFTGGGGTDVLGGGGGADTLTGGAGNDTMTGGAGADTYNVDSGTDTVVEWVGGTDVLVVSVGATARIGNGTVTTTSGADTISLAAGVTNNGTIIVDGVGGADNITGSAGADSLLGGAANDTLDGAGGADTLVGGTGDDSVTGGAGADTFVLDMTTGTDQVADFTVADDILNVGQTGALQVINTAGAFDLDVTAANGHVVLITNIATGAYTGVLTDLTNNGLIEQLISGAIENVSPGASTFGGANSWFTVLLDNGTDTGVYRVNITSDDGNLGSGDFNITLVGVLQGVADASTIGDGNLG